MLKLFTAYPKFLSPRRESEREIDLVYCVDCACFASLRCVVPNLSLVSPQRRCARLPRLSWVSIFGQCMWRLGCLAAWLLQGILPVDSSLKCLAPPLAGTPMFWPGWRSWRSAWSVSLASRWSATCSSASALAVSATCSNPWKFTQFRTHPRLAQVDAAAQQQQQPDCSCQDGNIWGNACQHNYSIIRK